MSTIKEPFIFYREGQPISDRYAWWAEQEIDNPSENISTYAKLIVNEYKKLLNGEIDINEFEKNTPEIEENTVLNYIIKCIISFYPN